MRDPIDDYVELAQSWGSAMEQGDSATANPLHDKIQTAFQVIRTAGRERELFDRANTCSDAVRFFIASHLKESDPSSARELYEILSDSPLPYVAVSSRYICKRFKI